MAERSDITPTAGPAVRAVRSPVAGGPVRAGTRAGPAVAGCGTAAAAVLALVALGAAPADGVAQQLPDGATTEMVQQGRALFRGDGFCYTCHGRDGSGMSGAGGDLTDDRWRHTDGSFEGLADRIREGVRANASTTGVPMPPAGGARLSPDEIRAVAAYVWTLSRGGG